MEAGMMFGIWMVLAVMTALWIGKRIKKTRPDDDSDEE